MSEELLPYYNRELAFTRRLAAQFAQAHPKIATRLRLGPDASEDPHVERMIEAFAYLNARTRHKLEDEFPELTESLLGILYPHYLAPVPSLAVVQFELDPEQEQRASGHVIPRHTMLETDPIQGEPCRFRTCYPVTLWPIDLWEAGLSRPPFPAPGMPRSHQAEAVLRLGLGCREKSLRFADLPVTSLRFFLKGQPPHVYRLYELIFNHTLEVALANGPDDPKPVVLGADCLRPVGFDSDEGLLPYTARSFLGYRLLTEWFVLPEKFLFFDLAGLGPRVLERLGNRLEIYLFLNRAVADLEPNVSTDTFRLGCTPMVNLFSQRAEPIQLTQTEFEYRVVPDVRRPLANEVYAVERVTATTPDGRQMEFAPFFSVQHAGAGAGAQAFWNATRRPAEPASDEVDHGTEVYLSLVDLGSQPAALVDWYLDVETTCLNRDLPHRLPFGGEQPYLRPSEGNGLVSRIVCLTAPTRTLRPARRQGWLWRLISHLSLNHLSLVENSDRADALREILKLHDFADNAQTRQMIDGILGVTSQRTVGRVGGLAASAFCRGLEVGVHFDEDKFSGGGLFLFAAVLERFFALYCTINSFTRLVATVQGRDGELRRWQPRVGEKRIV